MLLPSNPVSSVADRNACRTLIRGGSKSFFAASLLLPGSVRDAAYIVYAFCRLADDHIDLGTDQYAALKDLKQRLNAIYAGKPFDFFADRALTDIVQAYEVPRDLLDALLDGFEWDAQGRTYETIGALQAYSARVAGTVGAIMTVLMGRRDADVLARACDLGVAMQLTNIARDVGEDARAGRLYLPMEWMREEGVDPETFLANPRFSEGLGRVVARLLGRAESLYIRSAAGIAALPAGCRPAINAARRLYREIGCAVKRNGFDSVTARAVIPTEQKVVLALYAGLEAPILSRRDTSPALPETAFLVRAAAARVFAEQQSPSLIPDVTGAVDHRVGWILDLFMKLEEREKLERALAASAREAAAE